MRVIIHAVYWCHRINGMDYLYLTLPLALQQLQEQLQRSRNTFMRLDLGSFLSVTNHCGNMASGNKIPKEMEKLCRLYNFSEDMSTATTTGAGEAVQIVTIDGEKLVFNEEALATILLQVCLLP
jgi:hypothetical protein